MGSMGYESALLFTVEPPSRKRKITELGRQGQSTKSTNVV